MGLFSRTDLTLNVSGMSCEHCRMSVEMALRKVNGVKNAEVDLKNGTAHLTLSQDVPRPQLITAVETAGYEAS